MSSITKAGTSIIRSRQVYVSTCHSREVHGVGTCIVKQTALTKRIAAAAFASRNRRANKEPDPACLVVTGTIHLPPREQAALVVAGTMPLRLLPRKQAGVVVAGLILLYLPRP
ncbi:unnamed protein product [Linum trigynum]|uniref:Uncharacterized protein n=1 Tax=Linum trigynum TaxID=586398 RepID=A0AAV2E054_9ROSI